MRLAAINLPPFDSYVLNVMNRATELAAGDGNYGWLRQYLHRYEELNRNRDREGLQDMVNILRNEMTRRYGDAGRTDPYEQPLRMRPRKAKKSAKKSKKSAKKGKKSAKKSKKVLKSVKKGKKNVRKSK